MGVGLVGGVLVTCILCTRLGTHLLDAYPTIAWTCEHHLPANLTALDGGTGRSIIVRSVQA